MNKSMTKNAVLMTFKTVVSLFIPLITFPYISRVLQVEAIGRYNFASSIVNYFVLIAGFGISTYALREGTKSRNNRDEISTFCSEIFLMNIISSVISLIMLSIITIFVDKLNGYAILIGILASQILFTLYGRSWIYSIYEDFGFTTVVQLAFNVVTTVLLFVLVKTPSDIYKYAGIYVASSVGSNIIYGVRSRKYIDLKRVGLCDLTKHIKPLIVIFGTSIATNIYVNSDITILGWLVDDRGVGLYSSSVKIYNLIKQVMVAVITVTVPRLSMLVGKAEFKTLFKKIFGILITLSLPACIGLIVTSKDIITIIAGLEYIDATISLQILSVALVFALVACLLGTSVLLPYKKEKKFFMSTLISAIVNIVMNFILIPVFQQNAAALTTTFSQCIAFLICYHYGKEHIQLNNMKRNYLAIGLGCGSIVVCCLAVDRFGFDLLPAFALKVALSGVMYGIIQLIFRNEFCMAYLEKIKSRIKKVRV